MAAQTYGEVVAEVVKEQGCTAVEAMEQVAEERPELYHAFRTGQAPPAFMQTAQEQFLARVKDAQNAGFLTQDEAAEQVAQEYPDLYAAVRRGGTYGG